MPSRLVANAHFMWAFCFLAQIWPKFGPSMAQFWPVKINDSAKSPLGAWPAFGASLLRHGCYLTKSQTQIIWLRCLSGARGLVEGHVWWRPRGQVVFRSNSRLNSSSHLKLGQRLYRFILPLWASCGYSRVTGNWRPKLALVTSPAGAFKFPSAQKPPRHPRPQFQGGVPDGIRWSVPLSHSRTWQCSDILGFCRPRSYLSCHHFMIA